MDERVEDTRHSSFRSVPRISIESLDENNVHRILDGQQPVIVEGMDTNWPPSYRNAALEDIVVFRGKTSSVHIDGVQRFDVSTKEILDLLHAGKNCRVFGAKLKPEMDNAFAQPHWLFDHLHLFRYSKTRRPEYFLGSGGAVTPLHHDFELNANWHLALYGKRRVFLWTHDQSPGLFKLPIIGLSPIPFSWKLLNFRHARGYKCTLDGGEMLYMPPRCWHQVEYPECSVALTYAFYRSKSMQFVGTLVGRFWLGFMSYTQAFTARKLVAFATLPLLLPLAIFCVVYVAAMFFAHKCLGRASFLVRLPCQAAESLMFLLYWPLMYCFLRKMWVGY